MTLTDCGVSRIVRRMRMAEDDSGMVYEPVPSLGGIMPLAVTTTGSSAVTAPAAGTGRTVSTPLRVTTSSSPVPASACRAAASAVSTPRTGAACLPATSSAPAEMV
ncbi:hypothetical protein D3C72_1740350 [compost metagenome]